MSFGSINIGDGEDLAEENGSAEDAEERLTESVPVPRVDVVQGTGWFSAAMLIINAALGAGLLNFPQAFHAAGGLVVGTTIQLMMMVFIVPALFILAYCSDSNGSKTLQEVLSSTWGKFGQRLTSVCVAIYCFGTCITFIIIIGDQFDRVFASLYGNTFCHHWYMNRVVLMSVTTIAFVLPLCYSKTIDFLKHVSSVGVVAVIYVVLLIIAQYYTGNYVPGPIKTAPDEWTDVFLVVPVICFAYQCHVSVIPIYSCMRERNLTNFAMAAGLAIGICIFTYTVAATYGYLTFGSNITSDVLEAYDARDPSVLIAIVAIAIKTYTTYPILLFCGREGVSNLWFDLYQHYRPLAQDDPSFEKCRRFIIASVWFFLSLGFAIFLPNIGSVIKLLGSLAAVFIFIFPGMCLLRISLRRGDAERAAGIDRSGSVIMLIGISGLFLSVGCFLFGVVLTQAILCVFIETHQADFPLCSVQPVYTHFLNIAF